MTSEGNLGIIALRMVALDATSGMKRHELCSDVIWKLAAPFISGLFVSDALRARNREFKYGKRDCDKRKGTAD